MSVAADDDGVVPGGDQSRNVGAEDGLAEHSPSQNVTDGSVGGTPHFLKVKLKHAQNSSQRETGFFISTGCL